VSGRSKGQSRKALGKGLGALIPGAGSGSRSSTAQRDYFMCGVDRIRPDADQPRRTIDKDSLTQLVDSIREQGVIQPLIVRRVAGGEYELIAGERRWRAAQMAGLKEVPVVIKDATELEAFEMALVENIQREDLNPIEEAEAFHRLIDEHGYSQTEVATRVGRDRSTISNSLRLLNLPSDIKGMVLDGEISEGHARAVLQTGNDQAMISLAKLAAQRGLSVRETERRARSLAGGKAKATKAAKAALSPQVRNLTERLQRALGAKVKIVDSKGKGKLEISYSSYEELDGILDKILK